MCSSDLILGYMFLGDVHGMHSGMTHTPLFAFLGALLLSQSQWFGTRRRTFVISFWLILSHLVLDFFAGQALGFSHGYGIMWFYPFSDHRYTPPITLFLGPRHQSLEALLSFENLLVVSWELVFFVPVIAALSAKTFFQCVRNGWRRS